MTASLLVRLTPGSVNFLSVPGSGKIQIEATDVAAALAFGELPNIAYNFGLAKYCMDGACANNFLTHLTQKIQDQITINGWQDEPGRATRLAWLVLEEVGFAHECKKCNGVGHQFDKVGLGGLIEECAGCEGTGQRRFSERKRAEIAGIPRSSWKRSWMGRINNLYFYVMGLDEMVVNHLWQQLGERESA